jgi:hypothetical protein
MTLHAKMVHGVTDLVQPDVRMNGPGMEGDVHLCLLVGRQEAGSREGSKVRSQGSHIKGVLCAHIPTVLHLQTLLRLHHTHAAQLLCTGNKVLVPGLGVNIQKQLGLSECTARCEMVKGS